MVWHLFGLWDLIRDRAAIPSLSAAAVDAKVCFLQRQVAFVCISLIMLLNLNSSRNTTLYLTGLLTSAVHYFPGTYYHNILQGINITDKRRQGYEARCSGRLQTNFDHLSIYNTCQNPNTWEFVLLLHRTMGAIAINWSFDLEIRLATHPPWAVF